VLSPVPVRPGASSLKGEYWKFEIPDSAERTKFGIDPLTFGDLVVNCLETTTITKTSNR
jgi:hypothetical protein